MKKITAAALMATFSTAGRVESVQPPVRPVQVGDTTVVEQWDGSRFVERLLTWDGEKFVDLKKVGV